MEGKRNAVRPGQPGPRPRAKEQSPREGGGEEGAGRDRAARLPAPRSATWEVPAPAQAWPKVPPGGSRLGRGRNYTSAPGEDLKTERRGLLSGSKAYCVVTSLVIVSVSSAVVSLIIPTTKSIAFKSLRASPPLICIRASFSCMTIFFL